VTVGGYWRLSSQLRHGGRRAQRCGDPTKTMLDKLKPHLPTVATVLVTLFLLKLAKSPKSPAILQRAANYVS
jgi:hypothetical protein